MSSPASSTALNGVAGGCGSPFESTVADVSSNSQYTQWKDALLQRVLDALKQCQSHFGRQKLVSTDGDSRVNCLLAQLEALFSHGLRKQSAIGALTALKNVASGASLWTTNEPTLWPVLRDLLSDTEVVRLLKLTRVCTDAGRARSWLRIALNERTFTRHVQTLVASDKLLEKHYEPWAFIRDPEMAETLPQLCQGTTTILFAVDTDTEALDSCEYGTECTELLVEARVAPQPIMSLMTSSSTNQQSNSNSASTNQRAPSSNSKKHGSSGVKPRRPLVNVVSFEGANAKKLSDTAGKMKVVHREREVSGSMHSATSSSLCGSVASDEAFDYDTAAAATPDIEDRADSPVNFFTLATDLTPLSIMDDDINDTTDVRELRLELSNGTQTAGPAAVGARPSASGSTVDGHSDLGSPIPSSDLADRLTAQAEEIASLKAELAECKEQEQTVTKQNEKRLQDAEIEIEVLRRQLRSYADNIRSLEESMSNKQEETPSEPNDDYSSASDVVRMYEAKLLQVATMHAELVEFNDHLVHSLNRKRHQVQRLKNELRELRGPMASDEHDSDSEQSTTNRRPTVNIWIPTAFLSGKKTDVYHLYQIYFRVGTHEWNIYRRYSQFRKFHLKMLKNDKAFTRFEFPPKKKLGKKQKAFVDERRKQLEAYARRSINHIVQTYPEFCSVPVNKDTMCRVIPFICDADTPTDPGPR